MTSSQGIQVLFAGSEADVGGVVEAGDCWGVFTATLSSRIGC
jgi:hypothetical protein